MNLRERIELLSRFRPKSIAEIRKIPTVLGIHTMGPGHYFVWVDGPELIDLIKEQFTAGCYVEFEIWPSFQPEMT